LEYGPQCLAKESGSSPSIDMIGGTSTGGLITIMLGRLRERISKT
jgi:hypothetical protein